MRQNILLRQVSFNFADQTGFVFCNETIADCGVVGVALAGERLTVNRHWHLGWQPIGKEMTVTKADDLRVYTIDNLPAIEIYKKYLRLNKGADILNVIEFPLLTNRSGVQIARIPYAQYNDGSIGFYSIYRRMGAARSMPVRPSVGRSGMGAYSYCGQHITLPTMF